MYRGAAALWQLASLISLLGGPLAISSAIAAGPIGIAKLGGGMAAALLGAIGPFVGGALQAHAKVA